jgi:hypothetical protein
MEPRCSSSIVVGAPLTSTSDQKLQSSKSEIDQLLCVFVVNHELKKMNARKRPSKAKSSKHAIEDDCDDDAE